MKYTEIPGTTNVSAAEPEFEFSQGIVPRVVPYADVQHAQNRTWKRLSQSLNGETASLVRPTMRWQPSAIVAACTLTFVCGVWVGTGEHPLSLRESRVSAEPLVSEQEQPGNTPQAGIAHGHDLGNVANGMLTPGASSIESGAAGHEDSVARITGAGARERGQRQVAAGLVRSPARVDAAMDLVGEPASSVGENVVMSASSSGKNATARAVWHNLANKGEYEAALVEIAQAGGYERVMATANPEQLMLLSDVARATGQQQRALAALGRIVNEHSNDPVAPLAALNMGNLLDKMGDGSGATEAFARYRALSPKGEFAEDALVRQLRSAVKAGKQALAQKLVRQYEADFPDGRSAGEVAQLAEQLPETVHQVDAGVSQQ